MEDKEVGTVEEVKEQPKKLTYEELANVCNEMQRQGQALYVENQKLKNNNAVVRVGFLFEVLKYKDMFPKSFAFKCTEEIMSILTPPEEESGDTTEVK